MAVIYVFASAIYVFAFGDSADGAVAALQGHMVPMDQPAAALDMITRFMRGKPLSTDDQTEGDGDVDVAAGPTQAQPVQRLPGHQQNVITS
jgi:hypothetical protein